MILKKEKVGAHTIVACIAQGAPEHFVESVSRSVLLTELCKGKQILTQETP